MSSDSFIFKPGTRTGAGEGGAKDGGREQGKIRVGLLFVGATGAQWGLPIPRAGDEYHRPVRRQIGSESRHLAPAAQRAMDQDDRRTTTDDRDLDGACSSVMQECLGVVRHAKGPVHSG